MKTYKHLLVAFLFALTIPFVSVAQETVKKDLKEKEEKTKTLKRYRVVTIRETFSDFGVQVSLLDPAYEDLMKAGRCQSAIVI